ncbi:NFACT family protein [Candidatus Micrarchaeota archaeon]|nr:NFACT family protein [Candidatus Micrarchaeota archaeon]
MALSNLDVYYLVSEMKKLEGQHLQKVYGKDKTFRLKFRSSDVVVELPGKIYLASNPPSFEEHPSSFIMLLRKHLLGKLEKVEQINFDRIVRFAFPSASLVFELFGEGNIILCDGKGKIIKPLRAEEFSSRKLYAKEQYSPPPMEKKHPLEFEPRDLEGLKGKIVSALTKKVNLSPPYLEEACGRAEIGLETKVEELGESEKSGIKNALKSLFELCEPTNYGEKVSSIRLKMVEGGHKAETFSELVEGAPAVQEKEKHDAKAYMRKQQEEALEKFGKKEKEAIEKAKWLEENVGEIGLALKGEKTKSKMERKGRLLEIET